ncbi:MAG: thiamine phosphate synthase [Candidatus Lambdaproteobacteria bacterium]|nr:thiamine phosphate synthase [Candidatus Lambdaproteobacteria bacterium]
MLPFRFYLITDRLRARHDARTLLPALARAGLRAVQVREKDLAPRALAAYCRELLVTLDDAGAPRLYLNDRADLALSLGLHGVHLREDSLPLAEHAPALRERLRFGVSTHTIAGVRAAAAAGADFATFGPVYATASKAAYGDPVGPRALAQAAAASPLPLLALGGVTPRRVAECLDAGAAGVAAIGAIWNADEPLAELARFADALGGL